MRPEVAESLGLSKDVQVAPGSGDNQMSALGSGNLQPEILTYLHMDFANITRMCCTCSRCGFGFHDTFCKSSFQLQVVNVRHVWRDWFEDVQISWRPTFLGHLA